MRLRSLTAATLALALVGGMLVSTGCSRKATSDAGSDVRPAASAEATVSGLSAETVSQTAGGDGSDTAGGASGGSSDGASGGGASGANSGLASTSPLVPRNGSLFGFITAARPAANGGAAMTLDIAELHPTDESAAPGSPGEITNPTVDAVAVSAARSATVVTGPPAYEQLTIAQWLARRNASGTEGTELAQAAYWLEFKNGQVTVVRLQPMP